MKRWSILIELLAVFILIGIISLIAIPAVNSIMKQSKKSSLEQTGNHLIKSAEMYYTSCEINGGITLLGEKCYYNLKEDAIKDGKDIKEILQVKGDLPDEIVHFKFNNSGLAELIFISNGFICSNMVDAGGEFSYVVDEYNKPNGKGMLCIDRDNVDDNNKLNSNVYVSSGDGTNIGDEICIKNECFYVTHYDSKNKKVELLAKYNLYIGSVYNSNGSLIQTISSSEEGYGLQNKNALGKVNSGEDVIGSVFFSIATRDEFDSFYWLNDDYDLNVDYQTENNDKPFVFDEYSNIYKYVNNYANYLNSKYHVSATGGLISYERVKSLIDNGFVWVYSSTYWTGSASNVLESRYNFQYGNAYRSIWVVSKEFNNLYTYENYLPSDEVFAGVRPIITISTSLYRQ